MSLAASAGAAAAVAHAARARHAISLAIIVVVIGIAHEESSRVWAAPTASVVEQPAPPPPPRSPFADDATAPRTTTAAAEPDPRPAALHAVRHAVLSHRDTMAAAAAADGSVAPSATADGTRVDNVTRLHGGDVFNAYDAEICITDTCVGLSSGTAGLFPKNDLNDARKYRPDAVDCRCQCLPHMSTFREDLNICVDDVHECTLAPFVSGSTAEKIPFVFLPLRGQIIHPSKEISFQGVKSPICAVSGAQYLTTSGWMELRSPIDTDVPFRLFRDEGRTFLQWLGEADLRYKMQGRLVLVHLMCRDMSAKSVVHVSLEDNGSGYASGQSAPLVAQPNQNIFSPCVAFRVVGQPIKMTNNVTEVSFQPETQTTAITSTIGLSTKEYVAITICSLLLGLIYVASVLLYLYVKKRKGGATPSTTGASSTSGTGTSAAIGNEQVHFGTGFSRTSSMQSAFGGKIRDSNSFIGDPRRESLRMQQHAASASAAAAAASVATSGSGAPPGYGRHGMLSPGIGLPVEDHGVVKNNPLLKHYPNFDGPPEFPSDMSNSNSECGDDDMLHHQQQYQAHRMHHMHHHGDVVDGSTVSPMDGKKTNTLNYGEGGDDYDNDAAANSGGETECLPEENVSIVEDLSANDKLENMKAIVNGTLRRKLYFNPAYFEPHLLLSPPAAAIEFLNKIREVISIAKYKMATKRYQPSLNMIPEEGRADNHLHHQMRHGPDTATSPTESEAYQLHNAAHHRTNNSSGQQTPSSRCKSSASSGTVSCVGCPGCASAGEPPLHQQGDASTAAHTNRADCRNCGDKRNSIRKWLEDVSNHGDTSQSRRGENGLGMDADAENEHNILDKLLDMPLLDTLQEHDGDSPTVGRSMEKQRVQVESSGSDTDTIRASSLDSKRSQKRMAPAPPTPKIISHYLKPNNEQHQQLEINNNNHNMRFSGQNGVPAFGKAGNNNNSKIYDKIELLTQLTQTAVVGELFNNPQFKHHPCDSHETDGGSAAAANAAAAAAAATSGSDYEVMQNLKQHMPDMIYEAMAKDYSKRKILASTTTTNTAQSPSPRHTLLMQLPHPDYDDGSLSKKYDEIPSYVHVPTPDYNTFGRSKNNPQPDSPIYKRKSPHHLIVDYETDSLERHSTAHRRHSGGSHSQTTPVTTPAHTLARRMAMSPSSTTTPAALASNAARTTTSSSSTTTTTTTGGGSSSEASSQQPSPSLSTALPLEEELEIRHTVYDRAIGYRKDGGSNAPERSSSRISFANLLQAQTTNDASRRPPALPAKQPRIQYNTPSHGSMTIEVEHSPSEYELSTDSEQFEPDTLDRKAARRASVCSATAGTGSAAVVNLWSQHLTKVAADSTTYRHSSLENISSLPADFHDVHNKQQKQPWQKMPLVLRSSGSFKSNSMSNFAALNVQGNTGGEPQLQKDFNSLREIYEAKNIAQTKMSGDGARTPKPSAALLSTAAAAAAERDREMGRLLTLEARHSRRQRQTGGGGTLKKSIPPDVVPNGSANDKHMAGSSIYDMPRTPAAELHPKGFSGWNTANSQRSQAASNRTATTTSDEGDERHDLDKDGDTHSHNSSEAATEITGVSDTHNNSDSATSRWRRHRRENGDTVEASTTSTTSQSAAARPYSIVNKTRAPAAPQNGGNSGDNHVPNIEILRNFMSLGLGSASGNNPLLAGDMSDFSDTSTIKSGSTNFLYQSSATKRDTPPDRSASDELDKIEIVSSKSLSVHSVPLSRDQDGQHSDYEQMQQHRQSAPEANNNDTATIDHEQLLYDLTRPANRFHYSQPHPTATTPTATTSPDNTMLMASTKVFRCEVNPSSHGMQIALGLKDRVKKTKDLKYAWKRFVNIATSKFHTASNSNGNSPTGTTTLGSTSARMLLDDRQSMLSDADEGIASINDDSSMVVSQIASTSSGSTSAAAAQKPSRTSAAFSLVSRTPSNNSERSASGSRVLGGRHDPDSGYMSADSSESKLNSKRLYERFNFRGNRGATTTPTTPTSTMALAADDCANGGQQHSNLQDIKETSAEQEGTGLQMHQKPNVTGFIPKRTTTTTGMAELAALSIEPIEVFSSGSSEASTDDDGDNDDDEMFETGMDDDMCGSGAESVETNSVFFKNVRKAAPTGPPTK